MPIESLRPKFWEVAGDRLSEDYKTPFEKMRYLEQMTDYEMADRMCLSVEDYVDLEKGKFRVTAHDVLNFCDIVQCHPLDLYAEPWGGVPLPKEIFEALLLIADHQGYDEVYMQRTHDRLTAELHQARSMLETNADDLAPLMIALGYSTDLKSFNAPLYAPADLSQVPENKRRKYATQLLIDSGVDAPRVYIENCLNAYELELERNSAIHMQILLQFDQRRERNKNMMEGFAVTLFGQQGAPIALGRMVSMMPPIPMREKWRDQFLQNPSILFDMTPENKRILKAGGVEADGLRTKARLLFRAAVIYEQNEIKFNEGKMESYSRSAYNQWKVFRHWRHSPRTQRLLDWAENWSVLNSRRNNVCQWPPKGFPNSGLFPLLPG